MISVEELKGRNIYVLGLGKTGFSILNSLKDLGISCICWDDNLEAQKQAKGLGFVVQDLTKKTNWLKKDKLIISPGIPFLYPEPHTAVKTARCKNILIDNDIGLFFSYLNKEEWELFDNQPRLVAITGSNGKSTTSFLINHILQNLGIPSEIGGNFGKPVLNYSPFQDSEIKIIELSSYQTEVASRLSPDVSVFLNFSPDHLERHGGVGGYFSAKQRLFDIGNAQRNIIGIDDKEGEFLFNKLETNELTKGLNIAISTKRDVNRVSWSISIKDGFLLENRNEKCLASIDLRSNLSFLKKYNFQNLCAAYAIARSLGISPAAIEKSLESFKGLPHRNEVVLERNGVLYVNDSKATNVEAVSNSLQQYSNVHLILGGLPKKNGIKTLINHMAEVKKVYLIGQAAEAFSKELSDSVEFEISYTLEVAVMSARKNAISGDCILLAPACSSFDQFKNFEERGEKFSLLAKG